MSIPNSDQQRLPEPRGGVQRTARWLGDRWNVILDGAYRAACRHGERWVRGCRHVVELKPQYVASDRTDILHHVIVINNAGMPVRVTVVRRVSWHRKLPLFHRFQDWQEHLPEGEYARQLEDMMKDIRKSGKTVAVIVHGGMERSYKALKSSTEILDMMRGEYYPVFIVWDSWISAYFEQLFLVRGGHYSPWGPVTSPILLLGDLLSWPGRWFSMLPSQVRSWYRGSRLAREPDRATQIAEAVGNSPPNVQVRPPVYRHSPLSRKIAHLAVLLVAVWLALRLLTMLPFQTAEGTAYWAVTLVSVALVTFLYLRSLAAALLLTAGPRMWEAVQRRAGAMFRAPQEFDPLVAGPSAVPNGVTFQSATGAVALFTDELVRAIGKDERGNTPIKVTLIAHSMGSMITNEFIEYAGDRLSYEDIVYLAPACSVRDFADAVVPVLERDKAVKAYVLTLHPKTEANESTAWGIFPRGSVLEWIEGFGDPPKAHLDRMLGKFDNVMRSLHIFPAGVRNQIHIKAFPFDENQPRRDQKPFKHTHFNDPDVKFWERAFWWP